MKIIADGADAEDALVLKRFVLHVFGSFDVVTACHIQAFREMNRQENASQLL